jgi:hypothetical protein
LKKLVTTEKLPPRDIDEIPLPLPPRGSKGAFPIPDSRLTEHKIHTIDQKQTSTGRNHKKLKHI